MGISVKVAQWLKNNGHDALDLSSLGLHKLQDIEIIEKANEDHRIILTSDLDFGQLLAFSKLSSISVVQFRTTNFTASNIIDKIELLLHKFSDHLESAYLITVEDDKIRSRTPYLAPANRKNYIIIKSAS